MPLSPIIPPSSEPSTNPQNDVVYHLNTIDPQEYSRLVHQYIIRLTHYLRVAEKYMVEFYKLAGNEDLRDELEALSEVTDSFEKRLAAIILG